ncbi:2-C-methyl-D-erythritol 4-phosphate cytidylyltransferase [Ottowia sp.]|uniref:2-C-methyl-D-erythritol 4-phosphate cytidylyltransferase n=1 Tax=Ottowia sp. TaxID=1898956 RepID=UPI003A8A77C9
MSWPGAPVPRCFALIPGAGSGSRAGTAAPKQYQPLLGQPLVQYTLAAFAAVPRIACTLVVVAVGDTILQPSGNSILIAACGGPTRAASVFNGLNALCQHGAQADDWVLVHDAARCLVTPAQINTLIDACLPDPVGGLLALPLPDTLKSANPEGRVAATLDRVDKWLAQTPQMFRVGMLHAALASHANGDFAGITDEASAVEAAGHAPLLVRGSAQNFKVTYPEDFALAESVLKSRQGDVL